jgi:hypothetical protein
MALIEDQLRKALSKEHLFEALVAKLNLAQGQERARMQDALARALSKRDEGIFKKYLTESCGTAAVKGVEIILSKLFHS